MFIKFYEPKHKVNVKSRLENCGSRKVYGEITKKDSHYTLSTTNPKNYKPQIVFANKPNKIGPKQMDFTYQKNF